MGTTGYRRELTEADFDAEQRVRLDDMARNDRIRGRIQAQAVPADPHVICFGDGCASWQHFQSRDEAEAALARLLEGGSPLWAGATLVAKRREWVVTESGGRRYIDYDAETGEALTRYRDCPWHSEDARAAANQSGRIGTHP